MPQEQGHRDCTGKFSGQDGSTARQLYHHPVTEEREAAASMRDEVYGVLEEDDSDNASMASSARSGVRAALNRMKRNGVKGAANGRRPSDGEDVEHQIAV